MNNNKTQLSTQQHQSFRANGISNQLETFNFDENTAIRTAVTNDNNVWFLAKDLADALEYSENARVLEHCKQSTAKVELNKINDLPPATKWIPESDVYRLIMKSTKPEAEKFQDWVVEDVLPSIRETGSYSVKPIDPMALFADPAAMLQLATNYAKRIIEQDEVIAEQAPKVAALARLSESEGSLCLTDAAKTLKIPRHKLITHLSTERYIYKHGGKGNWIAYQNRIELGLLEHRPVTIQPHDGTEITTSQVLITPKGLTKLAQKFEQ